jgi:hypothetical protein
VPPTALEFDLREDGEPPQLVEFPARAGTDARFFRAFAFKPTVEGADMTLAVRAYVDDDLVAETICPGVTVLP